MVGNNLAFFTIQTAFSRQLIKYPWQLTLALLGVSIGIAVIVAIQLVRMSAYESFAQATLINSGYASHQITPLRGSTLPFDLFAQLKTKHPHILMSPVVQFQAQVPSEKDFSQRSLTILGIEPVSQINRTGADAPLSRTQPIAVNIEELMGGPQFAAINQWTSTSLQLPQHAQLSLNVGNRVSTVSIGTILPNQDLPGGMTNNTVLVDIATAQRMLGDYAVISRIDLDIDDENLDLLIPTLPSTVELTDIDEQTAQLRRMTQAFYTNLTALSLMALMMGVFLIYNTEAFLVLQRQQMIARLKALGVSNRSIFKVVLTESALVGLIGSLIGVLLGYYLAKNLLKYVSLTLNDLYFKNDTSVIIIDPLLVSIIIALGVFVTICAGYIPARSAATSPLVQSLNKISANERKPKRYYRQFIFWACLGFGTCMLSLTLSDHINGGFFAIACVLVGYSCLCAPMLHSISHRKPGNLTGLDKIREQAKASLFEQIGIRTIGMSMGRSSTAAAALMIATAAGIGIGVMVASFRVSVAEWLESSLRADFYISKTFSLDSAETENISPSVRKLLEKLPGINSTSTVLRAKAHLVTNGTTREVRLSAFKLNATAQSGFTFLANEPDVWARWRSDNAVVVTEPFAYHNQFKVGDAMALITDSGKVKFKVIGIYKDYASEQGGISFSRNIFDKHWNISGYSGLGIYTNGQLTLDTLKQTIEASSELNGLSVVSSADLLQQSLEVFDRTFLITNLLKLITIAVAFVGIVGALLAQQLERSQEYAIYRALGLTRIEILRIILTQTVLIGLVAAVIAIPAGLSVAWILIDIINPRSFGWTMSTVIPIESIMGSMLIAITAALIAGIIPAHRISQQSPATALRYE